MEVIKTEGIVLKYVDYKESSKILQVYTKDFGLISVLSKGCKGKKSMLRAVSNKMSYGFFYINYRKNGLSTLINVDLINSFSNSLMDIEKISYSMYMLEMTYEILKDYDENFLFELLINCLSKVNDGLSPFLITTIFELKCLDVLGVSPCFDCCVLCGDKEQIFSISIDRGGLICKNCYSNGHVFSSKVIQIIRMLYYVDIAKVSKIEISDEVQKELDLFIHEYYDKYTGLYLKSREFLKNLKML